MASAVHRPAWPQVGRLWAYQSLAFCQPSSAAVPLALLDFGPQVNNVIPTNHPCERTTIQNIFSFNYPSTSTPNYLLAIRNSTTPLRVGKNWVSNLVARRPELQSRYSRRYNHDRAKCEDQQVIKDWFKTLGDIITEHGILSEDIYNFDETGFAMGLCATTKGITSSERYGRAKLLQPGNREWVTVIEAVNAIGWALPPYIILKGQGLLEGWFEGLPEDWRLDVSPNGWTTDEIGLKWLQRVFIPAANPRRVGSSILLILDGHGSHLSPDFDQLCKDNAIICLCMPPHSSHLLQPLDVSVFAVLKRAYSGLVQQRMRLGFNAIRKADFLDAYPAARAEAFKSRTIQNGFKAAGIVPFQPDYVLQQLDIQLRTPTPPRSSSSNSTTSWVLQTPSNPRQLYRQANKIKGLVEVGIRWFWWFARLGITLVNPWYASCKEIWASEEEEVIDLSLPARGPWPGHARYIPYLPKLGPHSELASRPSRIGVPNYKRHI
ncbi:hypothetical protein HCAG_03395 [Histoplasma mississippiense (nom. inval.)]|uniref:hypothetical protein n=1 Tax=Ajellomyces capsulatus (strain NAm1 / WU24) TaxID=2059318 RepID=UPI000157C068|nr:hypothetical protein HCAG_03395 [Histoplasma mississippiense (nom. inval.)]EDN06865.1 hypothetical protein HCAG_03395 [Histoplasma mississippiense (nom. inval.)]